MRHWTKSMNKLLVGLLAAPLAAGVLANGEPSAAVGKISFMLGKATITQANGSKVAAAPGMQIRVSDVIDTEANGQVQIRFIDDELVSVRPLSTLEVVRYDYNPQKPQDSAIKLNLLEGTTRAISGKAAQEARQNFRMNTPIAAIGVRGTDFVVNADDRSVRAMVNEGAIVVAPFSSQCSADALGPCNQNAVELSGLSRQILELNATSAGISSALLPATNVQAQALVAEASAKADTAAKPGKPAEPKEIYAETVTSRTVNTVLASSEPIKTPETKPPVTTVVVPPALPEFTPVVAQSESVLANSGQLVWGRWFERNLDNERITASYATAAAGRQVTVGSNAYALFRSEPAGKSMQPGLGVLAFNLDKAQAFYRAGGQSSLMQVNGGQLSLDFNEARFSTSLQLNHDKTGSLTFAGSGRIYSGGYFSAYQDDQSLAGAVSLDGKEAGYFFEKILTNGTVDGLTLWNQKP